MSLLPQSKIIYQHICLGKLTATVVPCRGLEEKREKELIFPSASCTKQISLYHAEM